MSDGSITYTGSNDDYDSAQQSCASQEEPKIELSNLKWQLDGSEAEKTLVKSSICLSADVANADDGERIRVAVYERDEGGRDDFVSSVYGEVQGGKVEIEWKIKYRPKIIKDESVQEMQDKGCRFPEYVFKYHNKGKNLAESAIIQLTEQLELKAVDEATGDPMANLNFTLVLPDGSLQDGSLDGDGYAKIEDLPPSKDYPIIFHNNAGNAITVAKK